MAKVVSDLTHPVASDVAREDHDIPECMGGRRLVVVGTAEGVEGEVLSVLIALDTAEDLQVLEVAGSADMTVIVSVA